ncbi:hypothetical protein GJ496_008860 [Pomphorhynchus laevis]|nr:hypothetical protein GJ496_008860 [Pomphorhynchus laevis]
MKPIEMYNCKKIIQQFIEQFKATDNNIRDNNIISNPSIKVCIRKRPLKTKNDLDIFTVLSDKLCAIHRVKRRLNNDCYIDTSAHRFDRVFGEHSTNEEVFKYALSPLVDNTLRGNHSMCFAYGETGSGKTHTMYYKAGYEIESNKTGRFFYIDRSMQLNGFFLFTAEDKIISTQYQRPNSAVNSFANYISITDRVRRHVHEHYRNVEDYFEDGMCYRAAVHILKSIKTSNDMQAWCRIYELYMSKMYDLLNDRNQIMLLEAKDGTNQLKGVTEMHFTSGDDIIYLLKLAMRHRQNGRTKANAQSSRSHMFMEIVLRRGKHVYGKLSLIDLAGSEQYRDNIYLDSRARTEMTSINTSLMYLNECIYNMSTSCFRRKRNTSNQVFFRGCALTRLQRDSYMRPNTKVCMIATVCPGMKHEQSIVNTVVYAKRLSTVRLDVVSNILRPTAALVIKSSDRQLLNDDKQTIYSNLGKPADELKLSGMPKNIEWNIIGEPFLDRLQMLAEEATVINREQICDDKQWIQIRGILLKNSNKMRILLDKMYKICLEQHKRSVKSKESQLTRLVNMCVDVIEKTKSELDQSSRNWEEKYLLGFHQPFDESTILGYW